jgi:hypothetical protein
MEEIEYLCKDCKESVSQSGWLVDNFVGRKECYICGDNKSDLYCFTVDDQFTEEVEFVFNAVEDYMKELEMMY